MADGPSFLYEKLVQESWYYKFVCVSYVLVRVFFSYEKLGSRVIEMLRRYWLEVRFVFFTIFHCWLLLFVSSVFIFLAILLIMECYPEKKSQNYLSSLSLAMFLVRETQMVLCVTCIQISCAKKVGPSAISFRRCLTVLAEVVCSRNSFAAFIISAYKVCFLWHFVYRTIFLIYVRCLRKCLTLIDYSCICPLILIPFGI